MTPSLFPVPLRLSCATCGYRSSVWTAENLGGLQWIEDALGRTHEERGCLARPGFTVATEATS